MNNFNKNLGQAITSRQLSSLSKEAFEKLANKTFITFFHDSGWEQTWFPVLLNDRQIRFCSDLSMEICREKFGHTTFGIADGVCASRESALRDNL